MSNRAQLGDFLRRRRERLSPDTAGLPVGSRRRTPGLRRDEVAALANISFTYYERLEQGRAAQPSAAVLAGLSEALRLTDDERGHLYLLAGQAAPARPRDQPDVDPSLAYVLRAVDGVTPALITDDLGEVVAQNELNLALFGVFAGLPGRAPNLIWRWFTSPEWRDILEPPGQHEATGLAYVADLRAAVAQRGHDSAAAVLVEDLRAVSREFADMWDRHVVSALHCSTKVVHDPRVGRIDLDCSVLLSTQSRQRLLLLRPTPGTPSAERLARLTEFTR
jgi:transcriptional regulator with XRE-family HTH domain